MKFKLGLFLMLALFLTACQPNTAILKTDPGTTDQQASDAQVYDKDDNGENGNAAGQDADIEGEDAAAQEGSTSSDTETGEQQIVFEVVPVPPIDLGQNWFQPVNPLDVELNSGEYHLIEFSAFW